MTNTEAALILEGEAEFLYAQDEPYCRQAFNMAIEALQERKTGQWIDHSEEGYVECPLCGNLTTCEGNKKDLHYCFWCGARLEADE